MNVKQLKEAIKGLPDHLDVHLAETKTDFAYGLLNSVKVQEINFSEEPNGEVLSKNKVVILDEE